MTAWLFDRDVLMVATTVSICASVVPLFLLVGLKREYPPVVWIVAVAFFTALVVGDTVQRIDREANLTEGAWLNTWVWPPVQFAILARAMIDSVVMWWAAAGVIVFALWFVLPEQITYPDAAVTIVGSLVVLGALYLQGGGPLASTLLVYCGLGSAMYVGYVWTFEHYYVSTSFWYAYQTARLTAFALFGRAVWKASSG